MPNTRGNHAHLAALCQKHAILAQQIEKEQQRPSMSSIELHRLKAEKLKLKDQIEEERQRA